jgi:ABC-2 type transport system permease protein
MTATSVQPSGPTRAHYRPMGAVRSEWTKLRSVRSTTWTVVATVVLTIAIGVLVTATTAHNWAHTSLVDRLRFDPTGQSLTGLFIGQLALGVLGILAMSAEYGTGTIRATLAAIPHRRLVLAAKAGVFLVLAVVVGEVVSISSFFIGQAILSGTTPHATLGQPGVARAVFGSGLYLATLGMFALGLATMIRHTAGTISVFVGSLFILPLIVMAFPQSLRDAVAKYLPAIIGATMTSANPRLGADSPAFSPWVGLAVLAGYAAAALVLGGVLLQRRDA